MENIKKKSMDDSKEALTKQVLKEGYWLIILSN